MKRTIVKLGYLSLSLSDDDTSALIDLNWDVIHNFTQDELGELIKIYVESHPQTANLKEFCRDVIWASSECGAKYFVIPTEFAVKHLGIEI